MDKMIGMMTYHTMRWLIADYVFKEKMKTMTSPDEIKSFIWDKYKGKFINDSEEKAFIKGMALCDFNSIFLWVTKNR